jgi:hypothetical protein
MKSKPKMRSKYNEINSRLLFGLLQFVPVFPFEAMAGGELRPAFVVLPNFMVAGLAGAAPQGAFFQDVAFFIAIQFQEPRLLIAVQAIG